MAKILIKWTVFVLLCNCVSSNQVNRPSVQLKRKKMIVVAIVSSPELGGKRYRQGKLIRIMEESIRQRYSVVESNDSLDDKENDDGVWLAPVV